MDKVYFISHAWRICIVSYIEKFIDNTVLSPKSIVFYEFDLIVHIIQGLSLSTASLLS